MSRRADAVLDLIEAKKRLDNAIDLTPESTAQYPTMYLYIDEQRAYEAAVIEYEEAHAPTLSEIMTHIEGPR